MKLLINFIFVAAFLVVGCQKSRVIIRQLHPSYLGTGEVNWNAQVINDLSVRALYNSDNDALMGIQADRFVGNLKQLDVSFNFIDIPYEQVGDTLQLTSNSESQSTDEVYLFMEILEGDVTLEYYQLRTDRPAWFVINDWNPDTEEIEVSFTATFTRLNQDRDSYHRLGENEVRISNGQLLGKVYHPEDD